MEHWIGAAIALECTVGTHGNAFKDSVLDRINQCFSGEHILNLVAIDVAKQKALVAHFC
jgi:hypothetical protein